METLLDQALAAFHDHRRRRGLARGTLALDRIWLKSLVSFCRRRHIDNPANLTTQAIGIFVAMLAQRKTRVRGMAPRLLAGVTRDAIIGRLRVFMRFLVREGWLLLDPAAFLSGIRRPPITLPDRWVSAREFEAMVATTTQTIKNPRRDRALLEVLFGCGLRVSELLALDVDDVDLAHRVLTVRRGKGGRGRQVPITGQANRAVLAYIQNERPGKLRTAERALFLSEWGRRLSDERVQQIVRAAGEHSDRPQRASPHQLRHGYATELVKAGANVRVVQRLLGHARINSTERYTHVDLDDLRAVLRRTHPRERRP